jgi:hypothetical protein
MVIIRAARPADIDSLTALLKILFSIEEDFIFDETRQRPGLQMILNNDRACVLAAEADGQVIGMCSGQLTVSTAEGGPTLLVEDVVVLPDWHGRGPDGQSGGLGRRTGGVAAPAAGCPQ